MKGSVRKRGSTWSYRVDFGKSADGKRNQIEKGGYKTKKEADKALNDVLFQYNNTGDYVENQKVTFQDVYKEFMATEAPATRAYATLILTSVVWEKRKKLSSVLFPTMTTHSIIL